MTRRFLRGWPAALLAATLAGCGQAADGDAVVIPDSAIATHTTQPGQAWTKVAAWPNAPWHATLTAWTGSEVLIFGGRLDLGPTAFGPAPDLPVDDAAGAYDPATNRWRTITVPPFSQYEARAVFTDGMVYVLAHERTRTAWASHLWAYSVAKDTWRELAAPADGLTDLAAAGTTLLAWDSFPSPGENPPVRIYDIAAGTWRTAPANPWPDYRSRSVVGLDDGRAVIVEAPADAPDRPSAEHPSPTWRAAVLDAGGRTWRTMPPSGIAVGDVNGARTWSGLGGRVVLADPRSIEPAEVQGVHLLDVPLGGVLDVDAGRWRELPELPGLPHVYDPGTKAHPNPDPGWRTRDLIRTAGGDRSLMYGWAYDAVDDTWTELPPIPGDKAGLTYLTEIWAGGRLYVWANGKVAPTGEDGYWIRPTHQGWAWNP